VICGAFKMIFRDVSIDPVYDNMSSTPNLDEQQRLKDRTLAAFYSKYPGAFDKLRQTFSELFSIARQYSDAKSYDLTQRALFAITELSDKYLALRSGNLSVPTSTMAMVGMTDLTFDSLLIEELESFVSLAQSAISQKDRQASQQVFDAMSTVALRSLRYRALFDDHGSNPATTVIYGHIYGVTQDAMTRHFDDGVLAGLRALGEIAKASTRKDLYLTVATIGGNIGAISLVAGALKRQLIVAQGMQALMEILHSAVRNSRLFGSHNTAALLVVFVLRPPGPLHSTITLDTIVFVKLLCSYLMLDDANGCQGSYDRKSRQDSGSTGVAGSAFCSDQKIRHHTRIRSSVWLRQSEAVQRRKRLRNGACFVVNGGGSAD
jgi:hypothetical protein